MSCRVGCGACCIAISISSPIPGMPQGKPAGVRCIQLDKSNLCKLFGHSSRPSVCLEFKFSEDLCGQTNPEAFYLLENLESLTH
jgi:uncharacterized protein